MVLKNAGYKRRERRAAGAVAKAAPAKAVRKQAAVTFEDVLVARKAVEQFGGADRLVEAIKALERLS
jgi:hypothetical protein